MIETFEERVDEWGQPDQQGGNIRVGERWKGKPRLEFIGREGNFYRFNVLAGRLDRRSTTLRLTYEDIWPHAVRRA